MDFSFLSRYWLFYVEGVKNTILLAFVAVLIGSVLGFFIALARLSRVAPTRIASTAYVEVVRGTPVLVQLFIIYYGLQAIGIKFPDFPLADALLGISFADFMAGAITLALNSAAYVAEIFRAGIQAVDRGQTEAARSLGLGRGMAMRYVVFPQALRNILPALGNEFVVVIKESSIVSVIGVAELMYKADTVRGNTFRPFEPLLVAAACYFLLTFPLSKLLARVERRMRSGTH
jgi:His/Glu/Gln/Arg/opine family amino acid ABC transporter permease subunit